MRAPRPIPPPPDLGPDAVVLWRSAQRQLRRQGTWQDADAPLLADYCRAAALAARARQEAGEAPLTVKGSRGQPRPHPAHKVASEAAHEAMRLATALLLTPAARKRAGVEPQAVDDDPLARLLAS